MQWCRERLMSLEDIIIVECVCHFDSDLLAELFAAEYTLDCGQFSPTLFGEPVERQRKYMVMLRRGRVEWHPVIAEKGVQDSFLRLFARTLRMSCQSKFTATQEERASYLEACAVSRRLPARTRTGKCWSFFQLSPRFVRECILEHENALRTRLGVWDGASCAICCSGPLAILEALASLPKALAFACGVA